MVLVFWYLFGKNNLLLQNIKFQTDTDLKEDFHHLKLKFIDDFKNMKKNLFAKATRIYKYRLTCFMPIDTQMAKI